MLPYKELVYLTPMIGTVGDSSPVSMAVLVIGAGIVIAVLVDEFPATSVAIIVMSLSLCVRTGFGDVAEYLPSVPTNVETLVSSEKVIITVAPASADPLMVIFPPVSRLNVALLGASGGVVSDVIVGDDLLLLPPQAERKTGSTVMIKAHFIMLFVMVFKSI